TRRPGPPVRCKSAGADQKRGPIRPRPPGKEPIRHRPWTAAAGPPPGPPGGSPALWPVAKAGRRLRRTPGSPSQVLEPPPGPPPVATAGSTPPPVGHEEGQPRLRG